MRRRSRKRKNKLIISTKQFNSFQQHAPKIATDLGVSDFTASKELRRASQIEKI